MPVNCLFVKWQKHVYDYKIIIRNPVSDSDKIKRAPGVLYCNWLDLIDIFSDCQI